MKLMGAEILVECLKEQGVTTVFGYPGGTVLDIYDALYRDGKIEHVITSHEQGAAHAADGWARVTGKTGVVIATSGPGATNLVTGIATAYMDSVPVVAITGNVGAAMLGRDSFQEIDIFGITLPITKHNYIVKDVKELASVVREAFLIANSGRKGPVLIDILKNVQSEKADYVPQKPVYPRAKAVPPRALERAAQAIAQAQRPLIMAGGGVIAAEAANELRALAERLDAPVVSTLMGLGAFPASHPLFMGMMGMHGTATAAKLCLEADCILAVGTRFSDRVALNRDKFAAGKTVIQIDIDNAELGKNVAVELPIHADAGDAFDALKVGIRYKERAEWIAMAEDYHRREYEVVVKPSTDPQGVRISMYDVVSTLAEAEKADAVIVTDVGQHQMFSARYSKFNRTRSFITSGGLGTMGFGLPAAMGAKLGVPDREVVVMMGDGGFQMTMQELGTIMQNKIGVMMIVMNNHYLGKVRQWQQLFFEKRYSYTSLENPKFTMIAEAYGIPNRRVTQLSELKGAIDELVKAPGAYFLEVDVLSEENVFPMVPAGASLSDLIAKEPDKK